MIRIYGIKNCDTMKKAFAWLDRHGIAYEFHDYKKAGAPADKLTAWSRQVGWEALLNTRGTTWRKLAPAQQSGLDEARALRLMGEQPSLIKRPVIECDGAVIVGFEEKRYEERLGSRL